MFLTRRLCANEAADPWRSAAEGRQLLFLPAGLSRGVQAPSCRLSDAAIFQSDLSIYFLSSRRGSGNAALPRETRSRLYFRVFLSPGVACQIQLRRRHASAHTPCPYFLQTAKHREALRNLFMLLCNQAFFPSIKLPSPEEQKSRCCIISLCVFCKCLILRRRPEVFLRLAADDI